MCSACTSTPSLYDEDEPQFIPQEQASAAEEPEPDADEELEAVAETGPGDEEGEVPLAIAQSPPPEVIHAPDLAEVVIQGRRERHEMIRDLVSEAQSLLRDVKLEYTFTGKGKKEILRGRPVAFALWSDARKEWIIAQIEIPRPTIKWKPGGKPVPAIVLTPGITARHVKGTGAERLMFAFTRDGEQLKVYGRKFPAFDSALLKKKQWRAVVDTAQTIIYLPFTEDTLDPSFINEGKQFLLSTARQAIDELRAANVPSLAYPGELLADVVPAEVITTLAVIEQIDDTDFIRDKEDAFNEVLNQYGLKRQEAYRYSVSRAAAIGPMQFTNKRGNGTYAMVVRRCPAARIDPDFERGATTILNVMKAAICLFDIELAQMRADIRTAYHDNQKVLGIFPVAAYNGGPKNVTKLYKVMVRMKVKLEELRLPGEQPEDKPSRAPASGKRRRPTSGQ